MIALEMFFCRRTMLANETQRHFSTRRSLAGISFSLSWNPNPADVDEHFRLGTGLSTTPIRHGVVVDRRRVVADEARVSRRKFYAASGYGKAAAVSLRFFSPACSSLLQPRPRTPEQRRLPVQIARGARTIQIKFHVILLVRAHAYIAQRAGLINFSAETNPAASRHGFVARI